MTHVPEPEPDPHRAALPRWALRLHAALMPDYNRAATLYWWGAVGVGCVAIVLALLDLADRGGQVWLHVAAGTAVAMLAGVFPVRVPHSKNSFAAGEVFIFLLLLMHGPAAAVVAAAGEGAVGAARTSKRWTSRLVSPAMAAIAMSLAGALFEAAGGWIGPPGPAAAAGLIVVSMVVALTYFLANTLLITAVPRLKRGEPLQWADLFGGFGWVGIAYAGSAAVAALLFLTYRQSGLPVLAAMVPLLAMLLATLHYFFRQQESAESARVSREEAQERESAMAARHLEELQQIAFTDALTGLPNRRRFHEQLAEAVAQEREPFAVMFLDFDRFKLINDSLGHDAGDRFLVLVTQRIQHQLRSTDRVARLGGDEFAILALRLEHERYAVQLAERLMEALHQPFEVAGTQLTTSASIGITFSAFGYTTPEEVLRDADIAMYRAKAAGKARYALFDASLHREVASRLRLEGDLRRAIDDGQLAVVYQPVVALASGTLAGFEALVRWHHPVDGTLPPAAFLPIADEAGLMMRVTDFVLNCACRQLASWKREFAGALSPTLTVAVNVSGHDIAQRSFVARVSRALVESGLEPRELCLELTENILMERLEGALAVLGELRRLGVTLAIDDFGTGYSSLSSLSTLPIDALKIDRSFVARLDTGANEVAVVRSIVLLAKSLGKTIVAEGIETPEQMEQLRELGCKLGQGYHHGRPMPPDEVSAALSQSRWSADVPAAAPPAPPASLTLH